MEGSREPEPATDASKPRMAGLVGYGNGGGLPLPACGAVGSCRKESSGRHSISSAAVLPGNLLDCLFEPVRATTSAGLEDDWTAPSLERPGASETQASMRPQKICRQAGVPSCRAFRAEIGLPRTVLLFLPDRAVRHTGGRPERSPSRRLCPFHRGGAFPQLFPSTPRRRSGTFRTAKSSFFSHSPVCPPVRVGPIHCNQHSPAIP